jgi:hypothetical protein
LFLSSEDISQRIVNSPAPLLFIDTCIFLDILRSAYRDNIHVDAISSALKLIKLSQNNPPKIWLVTNETVHREWNENIVGEKRKLEGEIEKSVLTRDKLITAADIIFKIKHSHGQFITSLSLHEKLESLSHNLLRHCLIIKEEDAHHAKGSYRSTKYIAPAKRGKAESKDCLIFETFLDISNKIRELGYCENIYFFSSNSNDYGKPNKPLIIEDLEKINAKLINNLLWALNCAEGRI